MKKKMILYVVALCVIRFAHATIDVPLRWSKLGPIIDVRFKQEKDKMKLTQRDVADLKFLMNRLNGSAPNLVKLQELLPKVTLELLRSVVQRGVTPKEADAMAHYLQLMTATFEFENVKAFDENTSHIIGREWHEIDYSGEKMTWEGQKKHYAKYGISNFKSVAMLKKFFAIESTYPYFKRIYRPHGLLCEK